MNSGKFGISRILFCLIVGTPSLIFGQGHNDSSKIFTLGSPALTIKLPGKPGPMKENIEPSLIQVIRSFYAYRYDDFNSNLTVMLVHISYVQEKCADMKEWAEQAVEDLKRNGAENVNFESTPVNIDGTPGMSQKGTFKLNNQKETFTTILITQDTKVWKVVVYLKTGDKSAEETAQSILHSISFE